VSSTIPVSLSKPFRKQKLPVVLVNVAGTAPGRTEEPRRHRELPADFSELISELHQQPDDILITKRTWGGLCEHRLGSSTEGKRCDAGCFTGGTDVEATARQAYEAGFNVTLAVDAVTDVRAEAHEYSLRYLPTPWRDRLHAGHALFTREEERLTMNWLHTVSYFFGGLFLANVAPHFVSGIMGKPLSDTVSQSLREKASRPRQ
jgi:hypothetical protein